MTRALFVFCAAVTVLALACGDGSKTDTTEPEGLGPNWVTGERPAGPDDRAGGTYGDASAAMPAPTGASLADEGGAVSEPTGAMPMPYPLLPDSPPMKPRSGVLTAGSFDDHLNPGAFDSFVSSAGQQSQLSGWLNVTRRALISVRSTDGKPVASANVRVESAGEVLFDGATGSDGRALFLPAIDGDAEGDYTLVVEAGKARAEQTVSLDETPWTVALDHKSGAPRALDLAFVVDATGSMGDELEFLKAETASIAQQVRQRFPEVAINYGLIVYRDEGDEYVTKGFGFNDLVTFEERISAQAASGGGDYPEAMHTALQEAVDKLQWRKGNVVRMAFLLADAPPHDDKIEATLDAVRALRAQNVRLYPVAASGVADLAERVMRLSAFITLGRYLWLTDDSGVGNPHAEPKVPCYDVELLQKAMIRMISSELAGKLIAPEQGDIIRSVGTANDGVCQQQ